VSYTKISILEKRMSHAVIIAYRRSPFTLANKGALAKIRPDSFAAHLLAEMVTQSKIRLEDIEDVLVGCAFPEGEQGFNVARMISFLAKLPITAGAATINRFCGSSMQSIHNAVGAIAAGSGELFICGGVESMTRIPMGGFNPLPHPELYKNYPQATMGMGNTAEEVAKRHSISRADQEAFALASHQKAAAAQKAGHFKDEIIAITGKEGAIMQDGCIRPETSLEALANLAPAFDVKGTVTAGTSSPLTDGAAFTIVASEAYADKHGLPKLARIKSMAVAGCAPEVMGLGPIGASQKALARAGIAARDLGVVELNEAFAAQALLCIRELGLDAKIVNIDGGAIALGHPLGATGARITGKAATLLQRTGARYALATQCIGGGQGIATVLEKI
jgi:acetyl-CoA acyltransferase